MNRFKKEIKKKGIKLESDYLYLPYNDGRLTVEAVDVNTETATVKIYYTSIVMRYVMRYDGALIIDSL